jgi:DNA-directed RNA polymerase subunit beta'
MKTTVGQLLVNEALPAELRDYGRVLDKGETSKLFAALAKNHPDKYRQVAKRMQDIGWRGAQESGGFVFTLPDLIKSPAAIKNEASIRAKLDRILSNPTLVGKKRDDAIVTMLAEYQGKQADEVYAEQKALSHPLAMQVASGSRGNALNLNALLGSDILYADHRGDPVPVPILSSYSQGLTPEEYFAAAFGVRKSIIDTKLSVADGGYFEKQLTQVSHRQVVTDEDEDEETPDDVPKGLPVDVTDGDSVGALLSLPVAGYKRNTVLTPEILSDIRKRGVSRILVRSPIASVTPSGGLYAKDVGVRERGVLPSRGEIVGMTAAQSIGEPITQATLGSKHSGGVAGAGRTVSGMDHLRALVTIPKSVTGGATHAAEDGRVGAIEPAPAGGYNVIIGSKSHYVANGLTPRVAVGDSVDAGDQLSDGIPNPAEITQHKGLGEGRRYFVQAFRDAMKNAGAKVHRRNIEVLANGLINHVKLTDEYGQYSPDDVIPYSEIARTWTPRSTAKKIKPSLAAGKYLERPVLHHTIGTKLRPSMLKEFDEFGIKEIDVNDTPPPFVPQMVRSTANLQYDTDWLTRLYGAGLQSGLLDAAHTGAKSDPTGTSFVPALVDPRNFGRTGHIVTPERK